MLGLLAPLVVVSTASGLPMYWQFGPSVEAGIWIAACAALAVVLRISHPRHAALLYSALLLGDIILGVGLTTSAATLLFFADAYVIGRMIQRRVHVPGRQFFGGTASLVIGLAFIVAVWSLLVHEPVNDRWVVTGLLALPLIWTLVRGGSTDRDDCRADFGRLARWMADAPYPAFVACGCLVAWVARFSFFPSVTFDDNALHLRLWTELTFGGQAAFDFANQPWVVAPFAIDLMHALISLVAGSDARGAMNLALYLLILRQMVALLDQFRVGRSTQLMLVGLFASTPIVGFQLITIQAELLLALLAAAGARLALEADANSQGRNVLALLAIAALCVATKLPGALLAVTLLFVLAVRLRSGATTLLRPLQGLRPIVFLVAIAILGVAAVHPYVNAYLLTGNPVFPLYNAIFRSPFAPFTNFSDSRFQQGFGLSTFVGLFFRTSQFFEARDFSAGFQYLFMLPFAVAALGRSGTPRTTRLLLVPLLGFGVTMFFAVQYWRYLFPVLPLASVMMASLFGPRTSATKFLAYGLLVACLVFNLYFFPGIWWMFAEPLQDVATKAGRRDSVAVFAPEQLLLGRINVGLPGARVLFPGRPYGATLAGTPLYVNWYVPARAARFDALQTDEQVGSFLRDERVGFVLMDLADQIPPGDPRWLLRDNLARFGHPMQEVGNMVAYQVGDRPVPYETVFDLETLLQTGPLPAGIVRSPSTGAVQATVVPAVIATIPTHGATTLRYRARYACPITQGTFIAQVNWDVGVPYYHHIPCFDRVTSFAESVPIPIGAREGYVFITTRDVEHAEISALTVEMR